MKLAKILVGTQGAAFGVVTNSTITPLAITPPVYSLADILEDDDPASVVKSMSPSGPTLPLNAVTFLPPIDRQEVWAAGVTYKRSKFARMEESEGAARFYDLVYEADRPELFFKATPHRVVGPGQNVRIRRDATWNVPEPELAIVLNSRLKMVGYTIGNDMSSRDIEGANPLYLPQAKVYDACCALGPWITLATAMPSIDEVGIRLVVRRAGDTAFEGSTSVSQMARKLGDLVDWLGRDNAFPHGAFLLTGTGIVPTEAFTLAPGDEIQISIDGIGTLTNHVIQG